MSALCLLVTGSVAAADETAPVVDVPEDVLGADEIVFLGDTYTFDASGSTDDKGIVLYQFDFEDGGVPVSLQSTNGKVDYTFTSYGQTWVTVHAWDAAGNEGLGYFAIDVAEHVTSDTVIKDQVGMLAHSLYVEDADLTISNSTIFIPDGAGKSPAGGGGGVPDDYSESLTPDAELTGHWEPYYWYNYYRGGSRQYGVPSFDTDFKLSGEGSIKISDGYYLRGWEYHFDSNADLTPYNALTFYIHTNYNNDYNFIYQVYFYGSHSYSSSYGYAYTYAGCRYQGGYSVCRGWHGYTVPLDPINTGRFYMYNMNDLSNIAVIRIYYYTIYNYYSYGYAMWLDNVGIYEAEWKDTITESTNPSGEHAGYWSSASLATDSYVGDYSVRFSIYQYSYNNIYYYFNSPTDFSQINAMRFFLLVKRTNGQNINYHYYWPYSGYYNLYIYDADGHYCRYRSYRYTYTYYTYEYSYPGPYYGGEWYSHSLPWGPDSAYTNTGVDFTRITSFRLANFYYSYSYPSSNPLYYYIDGLEWYGPGAAGARSDKVPYALYVDGGDLTINEDSTIIGAGKIGGRVVDWGGETTISHATLDNMWHTEYPGVDNGLHCYGGLEVYGDATIDNAVFRNCMGPGLALFDGDWDVDQDTVDLHGTTLGVAGSPMIIMGVTERYTANMAMDVTGWTCEDSPKGTGILVMISDTSSRVTVDVHDNNVDNNAFAGIVVSNTGGLMATPWEAGPTANLDLIIKDQEIHDAGAHGIMYYAGGGEYDANVWGTLWVENVTVRDSGEHGMLVWLDNGATNLDGTIINSTFERNGADGIQFWYNGFFGTCDIFMDNITSQDNGADGMEVLFNLLPYNDGMDNRISPVATVDIYLNGTLFEGNAGWGVVERLNGGDDPDGGDAPPWTWDGPTRTTLWYNMTMNMVTNIENTAGGWKSKPDSGWVNADMKATHKVMESMIADNRGPAVYIEPEHDLRGGGYASDVYMLENTRVIDNAGGVEHNLGDYNYGYYSELHLQDCHVTGNDANSLAVYNSVLYYDGLRYWGGSRVLGTMVYVDGCRFDSSMELQLWGADDSLREDWDAIMGIQFTNNIVDIEDEDLYFLLGAWYTCEDFTAWADIGNNRFYRGYVTDGVHVEMYGGWNLDMDVTVHDMKIVNPGASGLQFIAGTLVPSNEPHQIFGRVMVDNVTVTNPGANGLNFTIDHAEVIGAKSRGMLEVHDMTVSGVITGIKATELSGKVYDTVVSDHAGPAVDLQYSTFDFYSCELGPVDINNIKVLTKGAARLWYDLSVNVKWASGQYVTGAVVTVQDNTWATISVDTVTERAALGIGYVNSYTVLPDTVYSKSPFRIHGTYLGLETEKMVDITGNIVVNLILVDDVLPRLTVNTPVDGDKQRETDLLVKGNAWDMHSGLESVMVSINDFDWFEAVGSPEFEYTFMNVPEGNLILQVKAMDFAGNAMERRIAVLVDATPPPIIIIEPGHDEFSTQESELTVIGVTEMGATVTVNNEPVEMEHTLFSTTISLKEGVNTVRVEATDRLGNWDDHIITVTLDTIPPPLVVTAPEADAVLGVKYATVEGQTEADAKVYVNGKVVANIGGMFSYRVLLVEGPNVISVESVDAVGNKATVKVPVVLDTREPWLSLASPQSDEAFGTEGILVAGWVEGGSTVLVNDGEVEVQNSYFTTRIIGAEGRNMIVVTVLDRAGNEHETSVSVWYDTTAPTLELDSPEDGTITNEETIEISGKLMWDDDRESFRDITLTINGKFTPFAANGEFRVQYELVEGTNQLFMTASDDVGNAMHTSVTVYMDSKAPFLLAEAVPTFLHEVWLKPATYRSLVYIQGVTEPGVTVLVDGAGVEVDESGNFNISLLLPEVPDDEELVQRSVDIVATDPAGNSKDLTINVYRLAPEEEDTGTVEYESAQWWVLVLSIIILVGAIVAAAFLWRRLGMEPEEYLEEPYEEEV